jgi:hypothetical protein
VLRDGIIAGAVAGVVSGAPSTAHALATGGDPLAATRAAGAMLLPNETGQARLLAAAVPVHAAISLGWGVVLAKVLPRKNTAWGAVAGLAIAALDLGVAARRFPRVGALPAVPQVIDHLVYGATVGFVLHRLVRARPGPARVPGRARATGCGHRAWRRAGAARSARS